MTRHFIARQLYQAPEPGAADGGASGAGTEDSGDMAGSNEVAKWETKFKAEQARRVEAEKLASQYKTQFTGVDLDEYKTLKEAQQKMADEDLRKRGEFEKIENSYKTNIQTLEGERNEWQTKYSDLELNTKLMAPFAEAHGNPIWTEDFLSVAKRYVSLKDGKVEIHDTDGTALVRMENKQSKRVETLKDLAMYIREETKFGAYFKPIAAEGAGGKGSPNPIVGGVKGLPEGISFL
jgi:hypothetical protein